MPGAARRDGQMGAHVVMGKQQRVPRHARICTLCFREVEDAHHTLFRCPWFKEERAQLLKSAGKKTVSGEERQALQALEKGSGAKKEEDCVLAWMMSDAGREMGMEFLDRVMRKRKEYVLY